MIWQFSKGFWRVFGAKLLELFYHKQSFCRYDFGLGQKDVREVARYWKDKETYDLLSELIQQHKLKGSNEEITVKNIMVWLDKTYPPWKHYEFDKREEWNNPLSTLRRLNKEESGSIDCDDYAILLYSLFRVAGVDKNNLRICFMKTEKEWHLNVMYLYNNVPYAIEGTYLPKVAIKNFGRVPYFQNSIMREGVNFHYYQYIRWLFNEDYVWKNTNKLNPLK